MKNDDGPAIENASSIKWWVIGKDHAADGPAIELPNEQLSASVVRIEASCIVCGSKNDIAPVRVKTCWYCGNPFKANDGNDDQRA